MEASDEKCNVFFFNKTVVLSLPVKSDTSHMTAAALTPLTAAESSHTHLASFFLSTVKSIFMDFGFFFSPLQRLKTVMRPTNILFFSGVSRCLQEAAAL